VEFNFANSTPEQLFLTVVYKHKLGLALWIEQFTLAQLPPLAVDFTVEVGGNSIGYCTDHIKDYLTKSLNLYVR
jgi:hypothetical protein